MATDKAPRPTRQPATSAPTRSARSRSASPRQDPTRTPEDTEAPKIDGRRKPVNPRVDRAGLREQADEEVRAVLASLEGRTDGQRLREIGRLTHEAYEAEKVATQRAVAAAFSSDFYDGTRGNLAPMLGVEVSSWAERRRRALKIQPDERQWLRFASREEIAERARRVGIEHLPQEEKQLKELGILAVAAQELKASLTEMRNSMIRTMYTASYLNPGGRTQPQLAQLAGIDDSLVWRIINPRTSRTAGTTGDRGPSS